MIMLTREDFANAVTLLETLTSDTVVKRSEGGVGADVGRQFDDHFAVCFVIKDEDQPCDIVTEHLEPAIRKMAETLSGFSTIEVFALPQHSAPGAPLCYSFPDSALPLRCTQSYDGVRQRYLVVTELLCRQVEDRCDD